MALAVGVPLLSISQAENWKSKLPDFNAQPVIALQLWSSYTIAAQVFDEEAGRYKAVDNRVNFQLRRSRLGVRGQAYKNLKFNFVGAFDLVGRDVLSGTEAGSNNGSAPAFRLWNAYLQWRILPNKEHLNLVAGYMPLQIGRESITSAFRSTSMEKSWSQNYLRRHLVGIGPGRAAGINIGGLFLPASSHYSWEYSLGAFNPAFRDYQNNSVGADFAPLLTARFVLHIGAPESDRYTLGHKINYFGKRRGLSLAIAGAHQGKTSLFDNNQAAGADFLLNLGPLNIDGEWYYLIRNRTRFPASQPEVEEAISGTGYLRASYNVPLKNNYVLEPSAMIVLFNGEMEKESQLEAQAMDAFAGREQIADVGVNFYFNPDLKLSLHYTYRNGGLGAAAAGATFNNYFFQGGVGAIQRGDWLGLGAVAIF